MNRAILIVICDFLVSAMLSMMTGMVPAGYGAQGQHHTGSGAIGAPGVGLDAATTALLLAELRNRQTELELARQQLREAQKQQGFDEARDRELQALARQLAEAKIKGDQLAAMIAARRENTGKLTPTELKKQLDEERIQREFTAIRLSDTREQLADATSERRETAGALTRVNAEFAVAKEKLDEVSARLEAARRELQAREEKLRDTGEELSKVRANLEVREAALNEAVSRAGIVTETNKLLERDLSFLRGQLSSSERELADTKSAVERVRKQAVTNELERNEAQRQLEDTRGMLKNAVGELSKTKSELNVQRKAAAEAGQELAETQGKVDSTMAKLQATSKLLAAAEARLRSDVFERYSQSAVRLDLKLVENRLLVTHDGGGVYFLPLVEVGGKVVMPGYFHTLAGDLTRPLNFEKIIELRYAVNDPKGAANSAGTVLTGPLMLLRAEPRLAALEVPRGERKPLKALTASELKQRGVQDLYLFKTSSFGKESAPLGGRCSIDFASRGDFLYIRNAGRGTGSELRAEPGDFVITKEGDFVGVVISVESQDFGRLQEAKCFLFPEGFQWTQFDAVPLSRPAGAKYFEGFGEKMRTYSELVRKLPGQ